MKFSVVASVLLVSLIASSMAVPAYKRMAYYQQQPSYYYQAQVLPQRMMYVQQSSPLTHARSTAFVAGDSVGAGSVLNDCVHPEDVANVEQQAAQESSVDQGYPAAGNQPTVEFEGTFSEGAEADASASVNAPEAPQAPAVENQVFEDDSAPIPSVPEVAPAVADLPNNDEAKIPREFNFEKPVEAEPEQPAVDSQIAEEAVPQVPAVPEVPEIPSANPEQAPAVPEVPEVPAVAAQADVPLAAPAPAVPAPVAPVAAAPVAPPKRYLPPRKKVTVKLDEQSEAANDDDDVDADSYRPARVPNARRPVKGNASAAKPAAKAPLPAGSFFPINFGGTSGGAIAIANSFSTGEGGSATSHAIAYGSPEAARAKARPVRRH